MCNGTVRRRLLALFSAAARDVMKSICLRYACFPSYLGRIETKIDNLRDPNLIYDRKSTILAPSAPAYPKYRIN